MGEARITSSMIEIWTQCNANTVLEDLIILMYSWELGVKAKEIKRNFLEGGTEVYHVIKRRHTQKSKDDAGEGGVKDDFSSFNSSGLHGC